MDAREGSAYTLIGTPLLGKNPSGNEQRIACDANGNLGSAGGVNPPGATGTGQTPITGGNQAGAAAALTATLAGTAGKTTYMTGFQITGAGATAASVITVTVTGAIGGTQSFKMAIPAGVAVGVTPLIVTFPVPLAASAANTAIVVNVPSFGAGNTDAAVAAQGFQQ